MLLPQRRVPLAPTPHGHRPQRSVEPVGGGFTLHHPAPPARTAPVVRESQKPETRPGSSPSRWPEPKQPGLLLVHGQSVLRKPLRQRPPGRERQQRRGDRGGRPRRGGGQTLMRQIVGGTGGHSQSSLAVHFGLGPTEMVDTVEVLWPSGLRTHWANQPANTLIEVVEGAACQAIPPGWRPALAWQKQRVFLRRRRSGRLYRRGQRAIGLTSIELGAKSIRYRWLTRVVPDAVGEPGECRRYTSSLTDRPATCTVLLYWKNS